MWTRKIELSASSVATSICAREHRGRRRRRLRPPLRSFGREHREPRTPPPPFGRRREKTCRRPICAIRRRPPSPSSAARRPRRRRRLLRLRPPPDLRLRPPPDLRLRPPPPPICAIRRPGKTPAPTAANLPLPISQLCEELIAFIWVLEKLRELSWSGVPPYMRPNIWRLLLPSSGYLSTTHMVKLEHLIATATWSSKMLGRCGPRYPRQARGRRKLFQSTRIDSSGCSFAETLSSSCYVTPNEDSNSKC
ncbi:uncharacterized protein LOC141835522 [Curcuma longa]|uniref:uncharacterized protein LOC141835522 n=1 Tax=Curcuma longa TaxID=136217 RepID=UPI003D9F7CEC